MRRITEIFIILPVLTPFFFGIIYICVYFTFYNRIYNCLRIITCNQTIIKTASADNISKKKNYNNYAFCNNFFFVVVRKCYRKIT